MIRRNFRALKKEDFPILYKTYVRPHLEYNVQTGSPYLTKDVLCLDTEESYEISDRLKEDDI